MCWFRTSPNSTVYFNCSKLSCVKSADLIMLLFATLVFSWLLKSLHRCWALALVTFVDDSRYLAAATSLNTVSEHYTAATYWCALFLNADTAERFNDWWKGETYCTSSGRRKRMGKKEIVREKGVSSESYSIFENIQFKIFADMVL